ncbi:MAG: nucleotidyltransferase domain-containing protein, partial [Sphingobacterium sp.]
MKYIVKDIISLTDRKRHFIERLVADLRTIEHIEAIALGGSHATGRANENSDIDIAIYYNEKQPFSIQDIREFVKKYTMDDTPVVVGFYEWGPWVNGGAWMHTEVGKVDILYRNINQIENTIDEAQVGKWENHYEQQPPYGFTSMIYLAECIACVPLYDAKGIINRLKRLSTKYPQALKESVINTALWSAEFTLAHLDGFASSKDIYNLSGSFARILKSLVETLFALNEIYPISDKYAIQLLSKAKITPQNIENKVNVILTLDIKSLEKNTAELKNLFNEVVLLTEGLYHPKFD